MTPSKMVPHECHITWHHLRWCLLMSVALPKISARGQVMSESVWFVLRPNGSSAIYMIKPSSLNPNHTDSANPIQAFIPQSKPHSLSQSHSSISSSIQPTILTPITIKCFKQTKFFKFCWMAPNF